MSNLFFLFLLTIVVAAFFGMRVMLSLFRATMPSINVGYAAPTTTVSRSESSDGNGLSSTLILLMCVGGIFWFMSSEELTDGKDVNAQEPATEELDHYVPEYEEGFLPDESDPTETEVRVNEKANEPTRDLPQDRVNTSPLRKHKAAVGSYGIQVSAYSTYENANTAAKKLDGGFTAQIFSDTENGFYRVVLTSGFEDKAAAKDYMDSYHLDGLVKELDGLVLMTEQF